MLLLLLVLPVLVGALESTSLLLDLAQLAARNENGTLESTQCVEQLRDLHSAWQANQSWALKALDASGSGFNNFMLANSQWLGNRLTCRALNEPLLRYLTRNHQQLLRQPAPFEHAYSVAYLRANSSWQLTTSMKPRQLLHVGLCVPQSCDPQQLEQLLGQSLAAARAEGSWEQRMGLQLELVYAKRPELSAGFLARPAVRSLLLLLAVSLLLACLASSGCLPASRILGCFDVAANWRRLWQLGGQEIAVISGLRVCSAFALIALHTVWYQFFAVNHSADMSDKLVKACSQIPLALMMEVFFVISGFLTVSNFLGNVPLQRSIASDTLPGVARRFVRQVAQRYFRLAPLQCIVILLTVVSFKYNREASVFHFVESVDEQCEQHWWRNLLLVQNLYPVSEMCCNWTWSLGCDMQFYIGAMLLLYTHTRHPQLIRRLVRVLLCGNIVYTVLLFVFLNVPNTVEDGYSIGDWVYTNPLVRISSYLIGGIYGYAHAYSLEAPFETLFATKTAKCELAGFTLWLFAQMRNMELVSPVVVGSIVVVLRSLLSAATAHLIFCSFRIEGSYRVTRWVVRFLESSWFQRLSRITYAIYLLNPTTILHVYYSLSEAMPSDFSILLCLIVAFVVIVSSLAIPLTLFFELPFNSLTNLFLASKYHKNKSN
ncbi:O-acyltransferase like protein [Drosophila mojavensis]|uniref:O-acyltransferase like protein n=1 Tax=Drosophila mojavensis TaxID=7230 RepID=UPI00017CAE0C|nr:O-acyltransferase like protein [Drosophila mojavensis]